jgi:hypothetical protein
VTGQPCQAFTPVSSRSKWPMPEPLPRPLHSTLSSFVVRLRFCPSPPPQHLSNNLVLAIAPSSDTPLPTISFLINRSFCHYSRAPTINSNPLFVRRRRTHRHLNSPSSTITTTTARNDIEPGLLVLARDRLDLGLHQPARPSLTSQPHQHAPAREELAPSPRDDPPSTSHLNKSLIQQRACTHHTPAVYFQTKRILALPLG